MDEVGSVISSFIDEVQGYARGVPTLIAFVALLMTFFVTNAIWIQITLALALMRSINKTGVVKVSFRSARRRVIEVASMTNANTLGEIEWICRGVTANRRSKLKNQPESETSGATPDQNDLSLPLLISRSDLMKLADGYTALVTRLNSRAVLNANSVPLVKQYIDTAVQTSRYLRKLSNGSSRKVLSQSYDDVKKPGTHDSASAAIDHEVTSQRLVIPHRRMEFAIHVFPDATSGSTSYELIVSHRKHLSVPAGSKRWGFEPHGYDVVRELTSSTAEQDALASALSRPRAFDGVMCRLVSHEVQKDRSNGHPRLHLATAGCTYSSVILDHYPGRVQADRLVNGTHPNVRGVSEEDIAGRRVGLLTLCGVPVTRDGYMVLHRRSKAIIQGGKFSPAIGGNLDLGFNQGASSDHDEFGLPDPRRGIAREAREEMGISLDFRKISIIGLVTFFVPEERGSNLLIGVCPIPFNFNDLGTHFAELDQMNGRWEVDSDFMGIRIPTKQESIDSMERVRSLYSWLLNSHEMTAHASISVLAALAFLEPDVHVSMPRFEFLCSNGPVERPVDSIQELSLSAW